MYVLELLIAGHREFVEQEHLLSQLVDPSGTNRVFINGVIKITNLFEKEVRHHMELEEKVIYPILRRALPHDQVRVVFEMEAEHRMIVERLKAFKVTADELLKSSSIEQRKNFVEQCREIVHAIAPHMRREYEILPHLVNAFFKSEDYKEVEELYAKFSH